MGFDHCNTEALEEVLGRRLTGDEMDEFVKSARRRIRELRIETQGELSGEALDRLTTITRDDILTDQLIKKRNAALNLQSRVRLTRYISQEWSHNPAEGIQAVLIGSNQNVKASRLSVAGAQRALYAEMANFAETRFRELGVWESFRKGAFEEWVPAARDMLHTGVENRKIPKEAILIARGIRDVNERIREQANRAGAWIDNLDNYLVKQTHNMWRVRKASNITNGTHLLANAKNRDAHSQAWVDFVSPLLSEETFTRAGIDPLDSDAVAKFLDNVFEGLSTGVHLSNAAAGDVAGIVAQAGSTAKKLSHERVLFFQNNVAWKKYNDSFGIGDTSTVFINSIENASYSIGLMEVMGPNAKNTFGALKLAGERMAAQPGGGGRGKFNKRLRSLDNMFSEIDGSTRVPGNATGARVAASIRGVTNLTKLGGAVLSAFPDIALYADSLKYDGVGYGQAYSQVVKDAFTLFDNSFDRRQYASTLGALTDGALGDLSSRLTPDEGMLSLGNLSRLQFQMYKWTGLTPWTDFWRSRSVMAFSHRLAFNKGRQFSSLNNDLQASLRQFGIGENEWSILRGATEIAEDGRAYMTPEVIREMPFSKFEGLAQERIDATRARHADAIAKKKTRLAKLKKPDLVQQVTKELEELEGLSQRQVDRILQEERRGVEQKLRQYYRDRMDSAVIQPDAGDLAFMRGGTQPGTIDGEIRRFAVHLRSFPIALTRRIYGRNIAGRRSNLGALAMMSHIVAAGWALGAVSQTAKDLTKGRTPRDYTTFDANMQAMLQGGALGIYGDLLFGEAKSRYGASLVGTLAGPDVEVIDNAVQALWKAIGGDLEGAAEKGIRTASRNIPFGNVWYIRWLVDTFIINNIAEGLSPGYTKRLEKTIERENNQQFIVPPSQFVDRGGVFR